MTAAHCFGKYGEDPPDFALIGGTLVPIGDPTASYQTNAPESFTIASYRIHPEYSRSTIVNDIAITVLNGQSKLPYVNVTQTAPLPGTVLTSIGWGTTETMKPSSQLLFADQQVAKTNTKCLDETDQFEPGKICMDEYAVPTANGTGYQGTCWGDSGMFHMCT